MNKTDLKDVLNLVKHKLGNEVETACGLFWSDQPVSTLYSVGEEDCTTDYAVGECDDPVVRYAVGE